MYSLITSFINNTTNVLLPFLLLVSINVSVFSQFRGGHSFAGPQSIKLRQNISMKSGSSNQSFVGGVGGISFDQMAIPAPELSVTSLTLDYTGSNDDGLRLNLEINGVKVNTQVYDWMLIPIALYAHSQYYACFTYFGELVDKNLQETILNSDGNILNYHPSLFNTLLGLRIADMDLLYMYDFVTVPPKIDGVFILGAGEDEPDTIANAIGLTNFLNHVSQVSGDLQQIFRSYIITDYLQDITFDIANEEFIITGDPLYYCWRYNIDDPGFDISQVQTDMISAYKNALDTALDANPMFDERDLYIDSLLSAAVRYETSYDLYASGTFVDLIQLDTTGDTRRNYLNLYTTASLYEMLIIVEVDMIAYDIEYLKDFSERISRPDLIAQANPEVWNSTKTLMKYSAFFRYVIEEYPYEWSAFIDQIDDLSTNPSVLTPTVMYETGNTTIEDALENYFSYNFPSVSAGSELILGACDTSFSLPATGSGIEIKWRWGPDDGSLSDINVQNPVIVSPNFGQTTTYEVTVTDMYGNESSDSIDVFVAEAPSVKAPDDITILEYIFPYTLYTEIEGTDLQIEWLPDDGSLNDVHEISPQIVSPDTGLTSYIVIATDSHGCTVLDTVNVYVESDIFSSISNIAAEFIIYPNPFNDHIVIKNTNRISRIELIDENGRLHISQINIGDELMVQTTDLPTGSYLLLLYTDTIEIIVRHVIKIEQ